MVFFTDRDLGSNIFPSVLRAADLNVERHIDHFPHDVLDSEWIPTVAERGWYVITHDKRIRYVRVERDAVLRAGLGMFVVIGHAPHRILAQNFVNTIQQVRDFAAQHPRPFIAKVYRPSPVSLVEVGAAGRVESWVP